MARNLLSFVKNKQPAFGVYIGDGGVTVAEIAAYAQFDYMRIDCEHTLQNPSEIMQILRIAGAADIPTLVRVSNNEEITKLLDFGATGILVPNVSTKEQAANAVKMCKYAPLGERGMTNISRCLKYGNIPLVDHVRQANNEVAVAIQIESREGLENIDSILSVDGVDIVTVGRQDISQSLGVPGQSNHPDVAAFEDAIIKKTLEYGKHPLISAGTPEQYLALRAKGIFLLTVCFDTVVIDKAFRNILSAFRGA